MDKNMQAQLELQRENNKRAIGILQPLLHQAKMFSALGNTAVHLADNTADKRLLLLGQILHDVRLNKRDDVVAGLCEDLAKELRKHGTTT